jgi:excisionase family DNA binding protein
MSVQSCGHDKQALVGSKERLTYTVEEAGRLLGICRNNAYQLARAGQIPTLRLGRRLLVPKAAFDRLIDAADR